MRAWRASGGRWVLAAMFTTRMPAGRTRRDDSRRGAGHSTLMAESSRMRLIVAESPRLVVLGTTSFFSSFFSFFSFFSLGSFASLGCLGSASAIGRECELKLAATCATSRSRSTRERALLSRSFLQSALRSLSVL